MWASVSIPPVSDCLDGTFRIYRQHRTDLTDLVELDSFSRPSANFLAAFQLAPTGVLVTGGPGSGKSTIVSALLRATPATTITRIVQEVRELDAPHLPGGRWSPEAGGHTIRSLVRRSLQFAPQLLVVGETLGEEAFELLKAANSGCGFLTTLHANTAQLGMQSLVTAALMAGDNVPERVVRTTFARLIDLVVHCEAEPLHRVPRPQRHQVRRCRLGAPGSAEEDDVALVDEVDQAGQAVVVEQVSVIDRQRRREAPGPLAERLPHPGELLPPVPAARGEEGDQGTERHTSPRGRRDEPLGVPVAGLQRGEHLGEQARLADAGLAGEQHTDAVGREGPGALDLVSAPHEPDPHIPDLMVVFLFKGGWGSPLVACDTPILRCFHALLTVANSG